MRVCGDHRLARTLRECRAKHDRPNSDVGPLQGKADTRALDPLEEVL
jgi:hypothetical protein